MTSDNNGTRTRQMALLGAALALFAGVGLLIYKNVNSDVTPQVDAPSGKPEKVNIFSPGDVRDRDAWRTKAENDIKDLRKSVKDSDTKAAQAEAQAKDAKKAQEDAERASNETKKQLDLVQKQLDRLSAPGASTNTSAAGQPGAAGAPRSTLNQPLPSPANGNRVLNPPGAFAANSGVRAQPGTSVQTAFDRKGGEQPRAREIEIAEFEPLDKADGGEKGRSDDGTPNSPNRPKSKAGRGTFIPASTFVKASQLYGVLAPVSGQGQGQAGNPIPIVFELTDLANLPNLRRLNATGCRAIAAATGDLSSERLYPRLQVLSCVLPNNEAVEMPVKGHVIGEDGNFGVKGNLVSKSGRIIAAQIAASFAKGVGEGFRAYATTQTTSPIGITQTIEPGRYGYAALGSGAAGGADALAQYYIKLSSQVFPVLEVDGGRIVELVFTEGVDFPRNLNELDPGSFAPANTKRVSHEVN